MKHIFDLIKKSRSAMELGVGERATEALLLYVRHFINKQTHRMPDIIH